MTLQRIAELAGVSKSTVSRVINNDPNVSPRTRAKVQEIIDTQQYQLNPAARALASSHTKILGVVIPNNVNVLFDTSFYFPTILRGISQATHARDYAVLLIIGDDSENDIRFSRRIVHNQIMDGLVLLSPTIGHPLIDELIAAKACFISADRIPRDDVEVNFVTVENVESSRIAVNHLIQLGRKRILMMPGDVRIIDSVDRIEGYRLALSDAGIPYNPDFILESPFSFEDSYRVMTEWIENGIPFDGVYASQSTLAVGAVNALLDAGIHLPNDVSLIAFDDLADSMNPRIGISTMRQPVFEKGYALANALVDLIEDKTTPLIQRFLPTELVIRDTCGGLKKS